MTRIIKGSKVLIISDNENYKPFLNRVYVVSAVYHNDKEHRGYDMGVHPMRLFELTDAGNNILPFCLYEYEVMHIDDKYK
jgi:hypothetical protein